MNEKNVGPVHQADPKTGDYQRCIDFHGHDCPGLAIGYRADLTLLEECGVTIQEMQDDVWRIYSDGPQAESARSHRKVIRASPDSGRHGRFSGAA